MTHGSRRRAQLLYPLVYIASLTLVALSSTSLAMLGRGHVIDGAVDVAFGDDQAVVRTFVESNLTATDFEAGALVEPGRRALLRPQLADLVRRQGYQDLAIFSSQPRADLEAASEASSSVPIDVATTSALATGQASARVVSGDGTVHPSAIVESIPVLQGADVRLVFQIRRDATPILARAALAFRDVVIVTGSAAVVLAVLLYAIFRAANSRLRRQDAQLAESRRRDPLTGLLNHGAAVAALTDLVEVARTDDSAIGVALVHIDNFRLLNDVHGSAVGDQALVTVAEAFRPEAEHWHVLARFGPDERSE